jgi:hypothetical protein
MFKTKEAELDAKEKRLLELNSRHNFTMLRSVGFRAPRPSSKQRRTLGQKPMRFIKDR